MDFDQNYWKTNYASPSEMDGIGNAKEHASYLNNCFDLSAFQVNSVVDFGFGPGKLFKYIIKKLQVYRVYGIEPSRFMFDQVIKEWKRWPPTSKYKLEHKDLMTWLRDDYPGSKWFDLGICTSVFQYLTTEEIKQLIPAMAQSCKYLYFSVPTETEFKRQREELDFHDEYAISRSKKFYWELLSPYFTCISCRLLESKIHFNINNTPFTDLLFRF